MGYNRIADGDQDWCGYKEVKKFMKNHKIKSKDEWSSFKKNNIIPEEIPKNPYGVFKRQGTWISWLDLFGKKKHIENKYVSYEYAKKYVKDKGIKNSLQWKEFSKLGLRPKNIPYRFDIVYKNKGWKGWPDFLGKE